MNNNENQRVKLSKRLIKEALLQMLETKNINKISIRELCQVAGINRTTFYNHYGSQYDVLNEMAEEFLQHTSYVILDNLSNGKNVTQEMIHVLEYIKENLKFVKCVIQQDNYDIVSKINISIPRFDSMLFERVSNDLEEEKKEAISAFIQSGTVRLLIDWIKSDCKRAPKEEVELLFFVIGQSGLLGN